MQHLESMLGEQKWCLTLDDFNRQPQLSRSLMFEWNLNGIHASESMIVAETKFDMTLLLAKAVVQPSWQRLSQLLQGFLSNDAAAGAGIEYGMSAKGFNTAIYRLGCRENWTSGMPKSTSSNSRLFTLTTVPGHGRMLCAVKHFGSGMRQLRNLTIEKVHALT